MAITKEALKKEYRRLCEERKDMSELYCDSSLQLTAWYMAPEQPDAPLEEPNAELLARAAKDLRSCGLDALYTAQKMLEMESTARWIIEELENGKE